MCKVYTKEASGGVDTLLSRQISSFGRLECPSLVIGKVAYLDINSWGLKVGSVKVIFCR